MVFGLAIVGLLVSSWKTTATQSMGYAFVTDLRLEKPEPKNWLMYRRTYDGWGYSPLRQITSLNVADLTPAWVFPTGVFEDHHQSPPIVNDGTMFVTATADVIALNAKTGEMLWRYARKLPSDLRRPHSTNRGVGLYNDKVYVGTLDAHVVALDAVSGRVIWDQAVEDYKRGYYITMAPLVADGKILVGTSGGEGGVRGFVAALDARTGEEVWKSYTIPGVGEPGNETWPGDTWQTGGGPVWLTGTYDPALQLTYWGTGNPGPWMGDTRPGDNLYTNSTIALDVKTGELRGYYQYHWNGSWDWDEANAPLLIDVERGGRVIPALVHPGRNGYLWFLERQLENLSFIEAKPYVYQNVFARLDPHTGRPTYRSEHVPGTGKRALFCPSLVGGKNWPPEAFNPETRLLYIPANENQCSYMEGRAVRYTPGQSFTGAHFEVFKRFGADHIGELQAWDVDTGERVWTHEFKSRIQGSVLTTGGGLVFLGGGDFQAFHAVSGRLLWQMRTNYGRSGIPTTYSVDGVQYVAFQSGAQRLKTVDGRPLQNTEAPKGGLVWAFALDCQC